MYSYTPNKEHIDPFVDRIQNRYEYETLRQCSLEKLHEQQWLIETEFQRFKATFPHEQSIMTGEYRSYIMDNPNETKQPLTEFERIHLEDVKNIAKLEIDRAREHRRMQRRVQRNDLVNAISDMFHQASLTVLAIKSTINDLKPWK